MYLQKGWISYRLAEGGRRRCGHLFLCHYCPREYGRDALSLSLLRFKLGRVEEGDAWSAYALEALRMMGLPPGVLVLRALGHREVAPTGLERSSLDLLGAAIARRSGGRYAPELLGKRRPTSAFTDLHTKAEREAELRDVYYWRGRGNLGRWGTRILLLDDVVTTGATASAILRVVHEAVPDAKLSVFSLARTSPDRRFNEALMRRWRTR